MILSNVLNFSRAQAQTDGNGLTDTNGIIFGNEALQDFHRRLVTKGVDASQIQEAYKDATASTGTYLYPADMLFLKAIELNYSDTNANNYVQATQIDIANTANQSSFSWLRGNTQSSSPKFDDRGDWFEIFPTPSSSDNLSQLIRIFYYLKPTDYTATTDTVAYPESLDTALLGWRIAAMYKYSLGKIDEGDRFNAKYEERVSEYIKTLSRGVQTPLKATPIQITGFEY